MKAPRHALVTGISGQDGSYLSERLLADGWRIDAVVRDAIGDGEHPIDPAVGVHHADLADTHRLQSIVTEVRPDVVFNLASISSVAASWQRPVETAQVNGLAVLGILDAAWRLHEDGHPVRVVHASSSEIFGEPSTTPQNESTRIAPINPYGTAKAFAHASVQVFRSRGLFAANAILYNHESPRRPETFVTRKITRAAARVACGHPAGLALGNLDARRDWGWAPDYVDALLRIADGADADDVVVATGRTHSVRDFVEAAFSAAGVFDWEQHVTTDPAFVRPADVSQMCGDASRARETLGWAPTVDFDDMVAAMVAADIELVEASVDDRVP